MGYPTLCVKNIKLHLYYIDVFTLCQENFSCVFLFFLLKWKYTDILGDVVMVKITAFFTGTISGLFNVVMGIMISVYMLIEKEKVLNAMKRITYAVLPGKRAGTVHWGANKVNLILKQYISGKLLLVPQFTLYGKVKKNRPSFHKALNPDDASKLFDYFVEKCGEEIPVETGEFGAYMEVSLLNNGPVTILLEKDFSEDD